MFLDQTDEHNPLVRVELKGKAAELPVNKNLIKVGGVVSEVEGVVVYAPDTGKIYLPLQAVQMIKGTVKGLPHITLPSGAKMTRSRAPAPHRDHEETGTGGSGISFSALAGRRECRRGT